MTYDHESPELSKLKENPNWNRLNHPHELTHLFSKPIEHLPQRPTYPGAVTNLISRETISELTKNKLEQLEKENPKAKQRYEKFIYNPVDYTIVPKRLRHLVPPTPPAPFSPIPLRLPSLHRITLKIWSEQAIGNKPFILSAIASLQAVTGRRGDPLFAERSIADLKIKEGMPLGCRVELKGSEAYQFLDKLVQTVLPRMREFSGFPIAGDDEGRMRLNIPSSAWSLFPDIEHFFDLFPKLFDVDVILETSGINNEEAILLLSGFQIPFLSKDVALKKGQTFDEADPWKKYQIRDREQRLEARKLELEKKRAKMNMSNNN